MAEDTNLDEISVTGNTPQYETKPLQSPWRVGGVVSLLAGPIAGLGAGIVQHFRNKSYLENAAFAQSRNMEEKKAIQDTLAKEIANADPDEQRLLQFAGDQVSEGYKRIAGGDNSGYQMIAHAQGMIEKVMGGDIAARKQEVQQQQEFQRGLYGDAAKGLRTEYNNTLDAHSAIDRTSKEILDLAADPNFDPNKPLNRAHLADLVSMGGVLFRDAPDMMQGIAQGIGAVNGTAGGMAEGLATYLKSEDFKAKPEDYNRIALNMQKYANIYAQQKMDQLGRQAQMLDTTGKKQNIFAPDFSVGDYVSGGEKELKMIPNPTFTGGFKETPVISFKDMVRSSPTRDLIHRQTNIKRPTN